MVTSVIFNSVEVISDFEGFRSNPYQDVRGIWTVGFGFTEWNGYQVTKTYPKSVSLSDAQQHLKVLADMTAKQIQSLVKIPLNQNQLTALTSFVFNVGLSNFKGSTMLKLLNSGHIQQASAQFLLWDHAGTHVVQGLLCRRRKEQMIFDTPLEN
ncbi:lysozyme [Acetobacter persici]|uniref:lysozyme n=1 Tax=Acetobacter persici TaxID=1076596 RepID=UPI001BAB7F6B|nr:lysozyme [Acetobacter persici]MBS1016873.1 lysozyme [Acetobacter persici]